MPQTDQTISVQRNGDVAIIKLDNPPVNALSYSVRVGLLEVLPELESDAGIRAILLYCAGPSFSAGADIREFGAPPREPIMATAMAALERSSKLTVVAIHGQALGGGLETALVFDYRCATRGAKLGLPEINLGMFPGGGGTQRLPRLIGIEPAIEMIISGVPIGAVKAKELGVVDELLEGDLLESALAYTRGLIAANAPQRRLANRDVAVPAGFSFAEAKEKALRRHKGIPAAAAAIDAVQGAVQLAFQAGLDEERRLFLEIRGSTEAASLRYLFAGEREVAKVPGLAKDLSTTPISVSTVIGAGTMGGGIAVALLNAEISVTLIETSEAALSRGVANITGIFESQLQRGRISADECKNRLARLTPALSMEAAADADIVIECVFEDMGVKKEIFGRLDKICKPGAILASNTSGLDVNEIAAVTSRPEAVLGMHFFSPANIMKLCEVVRGAKTAPEVLATAMALCKRIGKIGVVSGVCDGFIGNRMLRGYRRESEFLLLEGASPQRVDQVLGKFGLAMGPHTMGDMAGLDISAKVRVRLREEGSLTDPRVGAVQDELVAQGRFGLKAGKGMYRYEPNSRTPLPDPEVAALIAAKAERLGIRQREIGDDEIVQRCMLPLVNEGARILEEGIAFGAVDIDVIYCNGYGFPRYRGGPMFWADSLGIAEVVRLIEGYRDQAGPQYWSPAPLLVSLAQSGGKITALPRGTRPA